MAIRIDRVDAGSEAEALGLAGGDELLSVDGNELNDTLDYDFYTDSKSFHLKAKVADGIRQWDVRREERGPFGCDFSHLSRDDHPAPTTACSCFIDQLPLGCESLLLQSGRRRAPVLSVFGNYITMTTWDHEIDRIIKMHIRLSTSRSIDHSIPQLRVRMLANKPGGEVLKVPALAVRAASPSTASFCRGINDGDEPAASPTCRELTPDGAESVAAVPCGRDGLPEPFEAGRALRRRDPAPLPSSTS